MSLVNPLAIQGLELALQNVNLQKPLSQGDLLKLRSDCIEAPLPFKLFAHRPGGDTLYVYAQTLIRDSNDPVGIFLVRVSPQAIDNFVCADLDFTGDSFENARLVCLATHCVLEKARQFAERFPSDIDTFSNPVELPYSI